MAIHLTNGHITLTDTRQLIHQADADGSHIIVHNDDSGVAKIYLGDDTVTASNGLEISAQDNALRIDLPPAAALYGITATGTVVCSFLVVQ